MKKTIFIVLLFIFGALVLSTLCTLEHFLLGLPVDIADIKFPVVLGGSLSLGIWLWYKKRRQYAKALQESQERYRELVELTSDWIWQIDENDVYTEVSSRAVDILGYTAQEVIGKTPFDIMNPHEAEQVQKEFEQLKKLRKPFRNLLNRCLRNDGTEVVVETSGIPVFDAKGVFQGYRGIDCDITARKEAEDKLREDYQIQSVINSVLQLALEPLGFNEQESEELYRIVLHSISDAVFITDHNGRFTYICSNVDIIFVYSTDEVMAIGNVSGLLGSGVYDTDELRRTGGNQKH
jgi:PAS domain S-box-containing protein